MKKYKLDIVIESSYRVDILISWCTSIYGQDLLTKFKITIYSLILLIDPHVPEIKKRSCV